MGNCEVGLPVLFFLIFVINLLIRLVFHYILNTSSLQYVPALLSPITLLCSDVFVSQCRGRAEVKLTGAVKSKKGNW